MDRQKAGLIAFGIIIFIMYAFGLHFFDSVWSFPSQRAVPLMVLALVGTGIYVTIRLGFPQLRYLKHGINVNAISPGVVEGEHWDDVDAFFANHEGLQLGEKKAQVGASVPYGRMGIAEDLTGMAVFLASSDADYIVAQTYNVDGGQWMN